MKKPHLLKKAESIVTGHVNEIKGENQNIFDKRYEFCKVCPDKQDSKAISIGETCGRCGCRLQAKLRVAWEICPAAKWGEEV